MPARKGASKKQTEEPKLTRAERRKLRNSKRSISTTKLEVGSHDVKSIEIDKEKKVYTISIVTEGGKCYSRKVNNRQGDNSFYMVFGYFLDGEGDSIQTPDSINFLMYKETVDGEDDYYIVHRNDTEMREDLEASGAKGVPFSIDWWMKHLASVQGCILNEMAAIDAVSFTKVIVDLDSNGRKIVVPEDTTKDVDLLLD